MSTRHSRSPSPQNEPRKRGRIACVTCRQAKVRCDLVTAPCSRCKRMQLECAIDPGFRRTNKRDKFNELEDNVQRLKNIVEKQQADALDGSITNASIQGYGNGLNGRGSPTVSNQLSPSLSNSLSENVESGPPQKSTSGGGNVYRSLEDVTVTLPEVKKYFSIYFDKYHRILPILDPEKSHVQYYETSPILFWTILSVAMRTYQREAELLARLTPVLSVHLWTDIGTCGKMIGGPLGLDITETQTLLLLATWPLPSLRLWSDRSMTMANMALTSSMHMGLHRPGFDAEYAREPPKVDEKLLTQRSSVWVAAYCLSISIAAENGHEALVPSKDWLINNICSPSPTILISQELRHHAIIARHEMEAFKFFTSRYDNPGTVAQEPSFFVNVAMFEKALQEVDSTYSTEMSLANRIRSQGSLLLLQSMYYLSDQSLELSRQGVLRAYNTAVELLSTLISDDSTTDFLAHAPNVFLRIIVRAAFVILRTLFSTHGTSLDQVNGRTLFNAAAMFLRQMSIKVKEKDQALRVAETLKAMWKHIENEPSFRNNPPTLRIQSRLGATLIYDCLLYYRAATIGAQNKKTGQIQADTVQTTTPGSIGSNAGRSVDGPMTIPSSEGWTTPSFETFLESDLSWMDSLLDPVQYSSITT